MMNKKTAMAMIEMAKKEAGIVFIHYNGMHSGGLYSSSTPRIMLYLTKYPGYYGSEAYDQTVMQKYLDKVEYCEDFLKITVNHLCRSDKDRLDHAGNAEVVEVNYKSGRDNHDIKMMTANVDSYEWGGINHYARTLLIPYENIMKVSY